MTTLAKDAPRAFQLGDEGRLPVVADDKIFAGAAVGNASGYMRPLVAADPFEGFALKSADNTGGSAGDIDVELIRRGRVVLNVTGVSAVTNQGAKVYATDDNAFTLAASVTTLIGVIVEWRSGTECVVAFDADMVKLNA